MPVYVSQSLARSEVTSQQFKDRGILSGAPVSVANSSLYVLSGNISYKIRMAFAYLWALTASMMLDTYINTTVFGHVVLTRKYDIPSLFPSPPLIITITRPSEDMKARLTALNFHPRSSQRYTYFEGPPDLSLLPELRKLGSDSGCYTPFGCTNIRGLTALQMLNRILYFALRSLGSICEESMVTKGDDEEMVKNVLVEGHPFITKEDDITEPGILFPYFSGLVLVDKSFTPTRFFSWFSRILGATLDDQTAAGRILADGWSSLATTGTGMAISHLVYGIHLAIEAHCRIRPVYFDGQYNGFVLSGKRFILFDKTNRFATSTIEDLKKELCQLDAHNDALREIASILSATKTDDGNIYDVDPEEMVSPRHLHNLIRVRSLPPKDQSTVRCAADRLTFVQKEWEITDPTKVRLAISSITLGEFLEPSAPFAYKNVGCLFTKDPIMSTLAAFGSKSISLNAPSANYSLSISSDKELYSDVKPCSLRGIPYYQKPLQQAFEDWVSIKKTQTIQIKHSGNDRMGVAKLPGAMGVIPFIAPEARAIKESLGQWAKKIAKRKRESGITQDDEEKVKRDAKKRRAHADEAEDLLGLLPEEGGTARIAPEVIVDDMDWS